MEIKTEDLIRYALIAGGIYLAYQIILQIQKGLSLPGAIPAAIGAAAGGAVKAAPQTVADVIGGAFGLNTSVYNVLFQDGTIQQIPISSIDTTGLFQFNGSMFQLIKDPVIGFTAQPVISN